MKPLTNVLKAKIDMYRKNSLDISDLIVDVDLKGVDLSNNVIKKLYRIEADLRKTNFTNCIIGDEKNNSITFIRCNLDNATFRGARFIGQASMRSCNVRFVDFVNCDFSKVDYKYSNFTSSDFNKSIFKLSLEDIKECVFDKTIIEKINKM